MTGVGHLVSLSFLVSGHSSRLSQRRANDFFPALKVIALIAPLC